MISIKVILHTMTSIRLAGEVVNYLAKSAWEQFRRQNRVTAYFEIKETEGSNRTGSPSQRGVEQATLPRREKFYVPKIMSDMIGLGPSESLYLKLLATQSTNMRTQT
jgi:hypothetical protein